MSNLTAKAAPEFLKDSVIYQINLRTFTPDGTLRAAERLLPHIAALGADMVYLCPVTLADDDPRPEFWSDRQKQSGLNNPKNIYRVGDYYAVDPEYGTDDDLKSFVRTAHGLGLRVLLDLVYYHCGPSGGVPRGTSGFRGPRRKRGNPERPLAFPGAEFRFVRIARIPVAEHGVFRPGIRRRRLPLRRGPGPFLSISGRKGGGASTR